MTVFRLTAPCAVAVCLFFCPAARGQTAAPAPDAPGVEVWTTEKNGVSTTTYVTGDASSGTTTPAPMPKVSMGANVLYHSDRVQPDAAAKTARYLSDRRLIQTKDNLMLDRLADEYVLFVPVGQGKAQNEQALDQYRQTAAMLSQDVFGGQPVRITLTDKTWNNLMESVTSR